MTGPPGAPATFPPVLEWQGGAWQRLVRRSTGPRSGMPAWLALALAPAELLFRAGSAAYHGAYDVGLRRPTGVGVPVVSVGNLAVGGSGKTPVTAWVAEALVARGLRPGILHGGYAPDEPALHRAWHPELVVVARRDRIEGAREAIARGATALVLDDAFQHRRIRRDLDIVLVSAERWTPRPRLLPRGPWRERLAALGRADAVVVTRKTASAEAAAAVARALERYAPGAILGVLALRPTGWTDWRTGERRAPPPAGLGVVGVADPASFAVQAQLAGGGLERVLAFPDHHAYDAADAARLRAAAGGGPVLTTAKDAVKLQSLLAGSEILVLGQEVVPEQGTDRLLHALGALVP